MKQISMYNYITYAYDEEICPSNDDFSHITLAFLYSGVNQSHSSFVPDHTLGRKSSIES